MKIAKTILFGALLWVLIFFEVSILMFGFGLKGLTYYIAHYILASILVVIITQFYLGKKKSNYIQGLIAGLIFALTGIILDLIITVPLFVKDYSLMFLDFGLWIGIIIGIISATLVGGLKDKIKKKR